VGTPRNNGPAKIPNGRGGEKGLAKPPKGPAPKQAPAFPYSGRRVLKPEQTAAAGAAGGCGMRAGPRWLPKAATTPTTGRWTKREAKENAVAATPPDEAEVGAVRAAHEWGEASPPGERLAAASQDGHSARSEQE